MNQNYDIIPIPISIRGADGRYTYVNRAWCEMFSLGAEGAIGYSDAELNLEPLAFPVGEPGAQAGEYSFRDVFITTKEKGRLLLELIESRIEESKSGAKILCVHQDLTGIGWRMDEMSRHLQRSEYRATRAVQQVHRMVHDTDEALKQAVVFCDKLDGTRLDTRQRGILAFVRDNVRTAQNDIRENSNAIFYSGENHPIGDETLQLAPLIGETVRLYEKLAQDRGVSIVTQVAEDLALPIEVDREKTRQILVNLLESAIRSSNTGRVRLYASRVEGSHTPLLLKIVMENPKFEGVAPGLGASGFRFDLSHKILRGLCAAAGGRLAVNSESDGSQTYRVYLKATFSQNNNTPNT